MNLYFRLILLFFKIKKNKEQHSLLSSVSLNFTTLPSDCDINFHLTNSRYMAMMDLARLWMTEKLGLFFIITKRRWLPIVSATAITYIRDIKPLQKFKVESCLVGWDHKYLYVEQKFISNKGLHAIGYIRCVFKSKNGIVTIEEMLEASGYEGYSPELPQEIIHWQAMLEAKKQSNQ